MVVKHSGDQKRHRKMWKRHGKEVASSCCEVGTTGDGAMGGVVGEGCTDGIDPAAPPDMRSLERECPAPQIN